MPSNKRSTRSSKEHLEEVKTSKEVITSEQGGNSSPEQSVNSKQRRVLRDHNAYRSAEESNSDSEEADYSPSDLSDDDEALKISGVKLHAAGYKAACLTFFHPPVSTDRVMTSNERENRRLNHVIFDSVERFHNKTQSNLHMMGANAFHLDKIVECTRSWTYM